VKITGKHGFILGENKLTGGLGAIL